MAYFSSACATSAPDKTPLSGVKQVVTCIRSRREGHKPAAARDCQLPKNGMKVFFHCGQTQAGVLSNLLVASAFTGQLRNFPLAPRKPRQAWQAEKPQSPGPFAVTARI